MREALIDLDAVAHNTRVLAGIAGRAGLMAVVKANGFGHGAEQVARTALRHGASWLGVTSQAEALALRERGITVPVLMWLYAPDEDLTAAVRIGVDVSVPSLAHLAAVAAAAGRAGVRARAHLEVDTGLARNGAGLDERPELVCLARSYERAGTVTVCGLWSHLANAERLGDPSVDRQAALLRWAAESARAARLTPSVHHLANSAAFLQHPGTHFDLVRPGISLYGVEPLPGRTHDLRVAMTLRASVIHTRRVPAGSPVSYGHEYLTDRPTTLALLPLGFADGVPRRATGRGEVFLYGTRCRIARRIAMDQIVVDAGDLPVSPGDAAVVFGPGHDGEPTVADWASWADTNPHEILTGIGVRVPRRYRATTAQRVA